MANDVTRCIGCCICAELLQWVDLDRGLTRMQEGLIFQQLGTVEFRPGLDQGLRAGFGEHPNDDSVEAGELGHVATSCEPHAA